jgi:hypothetical protein
MYLLRGYLQFLQIPIDEEDGAEGNRSAVLCGLDDNQLHFDPDWCAIIKKSHSHVETGFRTYGKSSEEIQIHFLPTDEVSFPSINGNNALFRFFRNDKQHGDNYKQSMESNILFLT